MTRHRRDDLMGRGSVRLRAHEWRPDAEPKAVVALAHGYAEHVGRYAHVVAALIGRGYAVVALDHRGHGESGGARANVARFDDYVDDFHGLVERARTAHPTLPRFVLGHSMGDLIATRYALRHQADLAGLALSGTALRFGGEVSPLVKRLGGLLATISPGLPVVPPRAGVLSRDPAVERRFGTDPLCYTGRLKARLGHEMLRAAEDALPRLNALTLPLLVMHGADDTLTDPAGSILLHARARSPDKTLTLWPGDLHEIFNAPDRAAVIAVLAAWLDARVLAPSSANPP